MSKFNKLDLKALVQRASKKRRERFDSKRSWIPAYWREQHAVMSLYHGVWS